jgi:hypothetical protein
MDTEHRVIGELLALKGAPHDVLLDQVAAIGERAARHMLFDEAVRLQHTDHDLHPVWRTPLLAHAAKAVTSNWTGLR